jgi:hypothetical protein
MALLIMTLNTGDNTYNDITNNRFFDFMIIMIYDVISKV